MKPSIKSPGRGPLAVLGGTPAFDHNVCVGTPNVLNRERFFELANEALDNRWLTNFGPLSLRLQDEICRVTGAKYCLAVCNATIGLELAFLSLGLTGEVILPAFTFVATAHALRRAGLTPVFCDVDPLTHCLDPKQVEALITPRTSAILGVHLWGQMSPDVGRLAALARDRGLSLVYDAAHAFGCTSSEGKIADFGDAQVFSFHATKFINSFEGGAITTNSEAVFHRAKQYSNFGFAGLDHVTSWGTNAKLNEICAAMAIAEIERMGSILVTNRTNQKVYRECLDIDGIKQLDLRDGSNFQYVVALVDEKRLGLSRDQLLLTLWAENVLARRYFYPACHRMEPYASDRKIEKSRLTQTEKICEQVLILPSGETMGKESIEKVGQILRTAAQANTAAQIRELLPRTQPLGVLYTPESVRQDAVAKLAAGLRKSA